MKRLSVLSFASLLALVALPVQQASASAQLMCQGDVSGAATGARTITVTSSTASPQPTYVLGPNGCALIQLADIGFFLALGYTQPGAQQSIVFNVGVAAGATTDFIVGTLPAGTYIRDIFVSNSAASAITGGISFGTTANGTDVVSALTCGASCLTFVADAALLKRVFSLTAGQAIHAAAVTNWLTSNVTITIVYGYF